MKKIAGFTLAESLFSMAILGVVGMLMIPAISGVMPDDEQVRFLKALRTIEAATESIINDPSKYDQNIGATENTYLNQKPLSTAKCSLTKNLNAQNAYCYFVADKVNKLGGASCNAQGTSFTSTDGIMFKNLAPFNGNTLNVLITTKEGGKTYLITVGRDGKVNVPATGSGVSNSVQCRAHYWVENQNASKQEVNKACGS